MTTKRTTLLVALWTLGVLSLGSCRESADTADEAADLGATAVPDIVVSGNQPVVGAPDVAVKTDKDGTVSVVFVPSNVATPAPVPPAPDPDPNQLVTWNSLLDDFTATEDAAVAKTIIASELASPVFSLVAASSTCDDGGWNPNVFIDAATGALSGTPTNADVGTCTVALKAQGLDGYAVGTITVTVTNTPDAPTWSQEPGNISVADGRTISGQWIASDPDVGSTITYALDPATMTCDNGAWSPALSINATTGQLAGSPSPADRGTCTITVKATSGGSTIASGPHTVTITDLPDAPVWATIIPTQSATEEAAFTVVAAALDTDVGATITYSFDLTGMTCDNGAWSPALAINVTTGAITGTPTNADVGSCSIKVLATSGADVVSHTFTVNVANTNDAPTWSPALADFSHVRDSALNRTAMAQDVDAGATITYSLDTANMTCDDAAPAWTASIGINGSTGALTGTPAFANIGSCTIRIRAVSGADTIYDDVTMTVVDTSNAPTWDQTIADTSVNEDGAFSVTAAATDTDNSLTYSLDAVGTTCNDDGSWSPALAIHATTGAITGTPRNASVGVCNVRVVASGGGVDIMDLFQLTVVNTDDPLTWIQLIGDFEMNEDAAISKSAAATDMDPGATIAYALDFANMTCDTAGWSPQIGINATTGALTGTPVNPGICSVRVQATSSAVTIQETFTITVKDVTSPSVTVSAAQTSPTNATTINYTVTFNESVTGFAAAGINVTNGTKGALSGSGSTYTFNVTSPTGTVAVSVNAGVALDAAGNGNAASTTHAMATLSTINVDATLASMQVGNNQQYSASGVYSDSSTADISGLVTWSSTTPAAATVNASGVATGVAAGTANVTATLGAKSGFKSLTVNAATLSSISVTPVGATTGIGGTLQFSATGTYSNGTTQDVTESVSWTSSTTGVATVSNTAGSKGLASAVTSGTSTITATQGAVSATRVFTVTAATLDRIEVTPGYATGPAGASQQFYATAVFTNGTFTNVTSSVNWSSDDTGVLTVSNASGSEGRATLVGAGTATITATLGSEDGTVDYTVTGPTLTSIAVTPGGTDMPVGLALPYAATGTYSDASTRNLTHDVSWTTSSSSSSHVVTSIATVSNASGQKGVVTGGSAGRVYIRATLGGVTGQTDLDVTTATLSSIALTPAQIMLSQLVGKQFAATATFSDATTLDVTSIVNWTSSNTAVGTMGNSYSDKGYFYNLHSTASTPSITVTATLNSTSGTANVVITQGTLSSILINPLTAIVNAGNTQQFTAYGQYNDGASLDITQFVTWTSSASGIAYPSNAPDSHGRVTAVSAGSATITATLGAISDTSTVTVQSGTQSTTEEGVGLFAQYYNGMSFNTLRGTRTDSQVDFYWGTGNSPLDVGDFFSVRWTGKLLIPVTGTYVFCTQSDDGVRLSVNGTQIINNWTNHASTENCATGVALTAGTKYPVSLEFYENGGFAEIRLRWQRTTAPTLSKTVIPRAYLFPN